MTATLQPTLPLAGPTSAAAEKRGLTVGVTAEESTVAGLLTALESRYGKPA